MKNRRTDEKPGQHRPGPGSAARKTSTEVVRVDTAGLFVVNQIELDLENQLIEFLLRELVLELGRVQLGAEDLVNDAERDESEREDGGLVVVLDVVDALAIELTEDLRTAEVPG